MQADDLLLDDLFEYFESSSDDEFDLSSKWEPTGDDEMDAIAEDIFSLSLSSKLKMAHTILIKECLSREPGAFLSEILQKQLEALTDEQRQEVVNRPCSGFTPLVIACMRGHIRIVGYLIKRCGASIEPKDVQDSEDLSEEEPNGNYAPLWISISKGKLKIVKYLLKHGADVNTVFEKGDTGYTPLLVACFKGRFNVAKLLIEKGANIHSANFEGETCLMGALECVPLLEYLIEKGIDVNAQDHYLNTPLHYAIELHQLEAVRLLLKSGADRYIKNNHGDDSLQFACLNGTVHIVDCLYESCTFSKERILDTCELLGATFLYDYRNISVITDIWGKAMLLRRAYNLPKRTASASPKSVYLNATEFASNEELNSIAYDLDALRMQSLLIHERILGQTHMRTISRIWQQVNIYKDGHEYSRCITLMKYALTLRIQVDCLLWQPNAFFINDLDTLFSAIHYDLTREYPQYEVQYTDIYEVVDLIGSQLASCKKLLQVQPVFEDHLVNFNDILKNLTNLITILVVKSKTPAQMDDSVNLLRKIRRIDPRDSFGNTLLHLAVVQTTNRSSYDCMLLCKCLLDAGFNVNQVTHRLKTPLHLVSTSVHYNADLVDLFLSRGGHIDQRDLAGNQPAKQLAELSPLYVNSLKYHSLKCLAASVVSKTGKVLLPGTVPAPLMKFISQH